MSELPALEEEKRYRLANYICDMPTRERRRGFFEELAKHHSEAFVSDMRRRVRERWEAKHGQ